MTSSPGPTRILERANSLILGEYSTAFRCVSSPFLPNLSIYPFALKTTVSTTTGQSVTTLWRAIRTNKEDRVAKLEWAPNGSLGRAVIGKVCRLYRA